MRPRDPRRGARALLVLGPLAIAGLALLRPVRAAPVPPATPAAPAVLAADPDAIAYPVRHGDTLIGLSRRLLVEPSRWREIARASGLRDPGRIGIGQVLRIPLALVRSVAEPATVVAAGGEVRVDGGAAPAVGRPLPEGAAVATGADGSLTVRLVDGTLLRLRAGSRLELTESRRLPELGATRSGARLDSGRVEVEAAQAAGGMPGFRVRTPQGVLAVRGTEFRVESDTVRIVSRGEVLHGTVAFGATPVAAGQGSVIDADGRVAPPVPLLPAPDLDALPALQERVLVRFRVPPADGAVAWRGQVARDAGFDTPLADQRSSTPELRFADLPDGDYVLRVRAVDANGLEGRDADRPFRLKARPEAPLPTTPAPGTVLYDAHVDLAWAANAEAARYRLQLAGPAGFEAPLRDLPDLATTTAALDGLPPGPYRWRVRSLRADGDAGPWGDARAFEIRPPPPVPPPPRVDDDALHFGWVGEPGQRFEFQLARDPAFVIGLVMVPTERPEVDLPRPGGGRVWIRLRARDPDGYLGPWTAPQSLDLPSCLRDGSGGCVRSGVGEGRVDVTP